MIVENFSLFIFSRFLGNQTEDENVGLAGLLLDNESLRFQVSFLFLHFLTCQTQNEPLGVFINY